MLSDQLNVFFTYKLDLHDIILFASIKFFIQVQEYIVVTNMGSFGKNISSTLFLFIGILIITPGFASHTNEKNP